jgi:AraC-like DNA-binding protein
MRQIPLVRKVVLEPALSFLNGEGIPVDRHLCRAKVLAPEPETRDSLMPLHQLCVFLNSVSWSEGMPDLGFHIAGRLGIESLGTYGRLVMQAFTLHEFIQLSMELISAYNSGLRIWTEQHGNEVRYCQKYDESLSSGMTREIVHLGLANALSHASLAVGSTFRPRRIELSTDAVNLGRYFPHLKDVPSEFNRSHTAVWFDRRLMSQPLPAFDESASIPLISRAERERFFGSAPSPGLAGQLEQVIESSLGHSAVGLQLTASIIGTSPRTLQRRLAEENQVFGRLLQSTRFRLAQRLLREPAMPLAEIARRLSYAGSANFIRAFKRWTGIRPSEFRRLHCGEQSE